MSPSFIFPQGWTAVHPEAANGPYADQNEVSDGMWSKPTIQTESIKTDPRGYPLLPQPSEDPLDPLNWKPWLKFAIILQVALSAFLGLFSQEIINLAYDTLSESMDVTAKVASYSTTIAVVSAGIAPLIYAPISNIYGRRPVYLVGTAIGIAANAGCAVCKSWRPFLIARACVGIGTSVGISIGAATVSDLYFVHHRGVFMGLYGIFVVNGAHFASVISGFVAHYAGWHWCCWITAIALGTTWVLNIFSFPETLYRPNAASSAYRRNGSLIRLLRFKAIEKTGRMRPRHILSCFSMLAYPSVLLSALYYSIAFGAGTSLAHVTGVTTFGETYQFTIPQTGMATGIPAIVGSTLGEFLSGPMSDEMLYITNMYHGYAHPETRLHATWLGAFLLPAGVIIQGVCLQVQTHWAGPMAGIGIAAFGLQIVSTPIYAYLVDCHSQQAAEVAAILNLGRLMFSFTLRFYMIPLAKATTYGIAWAAIAMVSVALYSGVVILIWKEPSLRRNWTQ